MSILLEYKCPNCDGAIKFDSDLQKMQCPHCNNEFEVESLKQHDEVLKAGAEEDLEWAQYNEKSINEEWKEGEEEGVCVYSCNSCGGEIITTEQTGATKCPYCENSVVIAAQFSGMLRPNFVIPFKLNKEHAKEKLKAFYRRKFLLPSLFKSKNKIDDIMGIYVPFWLFSCNSISQIHYEAIKTRRYRDSNYNYVESNHYLVSRGGEARFGNVPVDGSRKINDTDMESIEPFLYEDLKEFQTAYLAGYVADKYDVDAKAAMPRINDRIKNTLVQIFEPSEYSSSSVKSVNIQLKEDQVQYVLLPLWIINTKYKDKLYTFFMNGQTGKFSGKLPISIKKVMGYFSGIFASLVSVSAVIIYTIL